MNGVQHKIVGAGFGVAAAYALSMNGNGYGSVIIAASVVGSMLPDIDHDRTKLGRKRKVVTETTSKLFNTLLIAGVLVSAVLLYLTYRGIVDYGINMKNLAIALAGFIAIIIAKSIITNSSAYKWAVKHRGFMHTLFPPAAILWCTTITDAPNIKWSIVGILIGYLSHLFADSLTVDGVPILFPIYWGTVGLKLFKTSDKSTDIVAWVAAVLPVIITVFITNKY